MEFSYDLLKETIETAGVTLVALPGGSVLLSIRCLAANPDTPRAVLEILALHPNECVLERLAENTATPVEIIDRLALHYSPTVRAAVTENGSAREEILWLLAEDESPDVRYRLAENPHTPRGIVEALVNDENPYVSFRAQQTLVCLDSKGIIGRIRPFSRKQKVVG